MQKRKMKKNRRKEYLIILGILLILISIGTIICKYYQISKVKDTDKENLVEFYETQEEVPQEQEEITEQQVEVKEDIKRENYLAVLKINKINLERGIYSKQSINNNVNKNIKLLKESDMPDKENGNVIIAGHSGNSYVAFFKNLVKLNTGDEAIIYYNGKSYIYNLDKSYEVDKTGKISLSKTNIQTLTLITCKHNTNKQIVFVFNLKNII